MRCPYTKGGTVQQWEATNEHGCVMDLDLNSDGKLPDTEACTHVPCEHLQVIYRDQSRVWSIPGMGEGGIRGMGHKETLGGHRGETQISILVLVT